MWVLPYFWQLSFQPFCKQLRQSLLVKQQNAGFRDCIWSFSNKTRRTWKPFTHMEIFSDLLQKWLLSFETHIFVASFLFWWVGWLLGTRWDCLKILIVHGRKAALNPTWVWTKPKTSINLMHMVQRAISQHLPVNWNQGEHSGNCNMKPRHDSSELK